MAFDTLLAQNQQLRLDEATSMFNVQIDTARLLCNKFGLAASPENLVRVAQVLAVDYLAEVQRTTT